MRMFGRPHGVLGRLGGLIMARTNQKCAAWVIDRLEILSNDKILEVGFGPGVGIELLGRSAPAGYVAGVDPSKEMVEAATARNAKALKSGQVDLRIGSVERLPFDDNIFGKALAINSMQVWLDAMAGLREIRRVLKAGGRIALGGIPHSGHSKSGVPNKSRRRLLAEYVDGPFLSVPKKNVQTYRRIAQMAGKIWREHGALECRECARDDLHADRTYAIRRTCPSTPRTWSMVVSKS